MADNPNPAMDVVEDPKRTTPDIPERSLARRIGRWILMLSVPLMLAAFGIFYWITSDRYASTDNAYVQQDIVSVSAEVGGKIVEVGVSENQQVAAGDLLFSIDPVPFELALAQSNARVAAAQVEVQNLQTDYQVSGVDIEVARQDIAFAQSNYQRQAALMDKGFTTRARLDAAQHEVDLARAKLKSAQADVVAAKARLSTGSASPGEYPAVADAKVARDQARLNLDRTRVVAPVAGRIAQSTRLQIGQMMVSGLPMVSIVNDASSWIEANFKETDLARMKVGQKAKISFDAYPGLELNGRVDSIGAGTGSEFSVLPAQNANGNWVKVTQRVPVRIKILDKSARQLIAGISAEVTVDLRNGSE
ncbi:HlyD family secretion protein [Parasphingorhabdus sp.]|jgi:membrane fusion protein (multidrug efflux system)|uniref:HlyD family secretion protein n=1 Tax=Parasphingorhabdus sp. TaxID=2709688 RepID=UPI0030013A19